MFQIRKQGTEEWYAPHRDILNILPQYIYESLETLQNIRNELPPDKQKILDESVYKFMNIYIQILSKDFSEIENELQNLLFDPMFSSFSIHIFYKIFKLFYIELRTYTIQSEKVEVNKKLYQIKQILRRDDDKEEQIK